MMRGEMRMNKKLVILLLLLISIAVYVWANTGAHSTSTGDVIEEIRQELGLQSDQAIDPDEVPAPLLEELGEAVMSEIHPNERVHSWMDSMMGGDGSESLTSAHRWMGYRYLLYGGRNHGYNRGMGYGGMMGPGMMGWAYGGRGPASGIIPYDSPEEVLKQRYARGEIDREEYLRALEDLKK